MEGGRRREEGGRRREEGGGRKEEGGRGREGGRRREEGGRKGEGGRGRVKVYSSCVIKTHAERRSRERGAVDAISCLGKNCLVGESRNVKEGRIRS